MIYLFNHESAIGESLHIGERGEGTWVVSWGFIERRGRYEVWSKNYSCVPFSTEQEAKDEAYRIFAVSRLTG